MNLSAANMPGTYLTSARVRFTNQGKLNITTRTYNGQLFKKSLGTLQLSSLRYGGFPIDCVAALGHSPVRISTGEIFMMTQDEMTDKISHIRGRGLILKPENLITSINDRYGPKRCIGLLVAVASIPEIDTTIDIMGAARNSAFVAKATLPVDMQNKIKDLDRLLKNSANFDVMRINELQREIQETASQYDYRISVFEKYKRIENKFSFKLEPVNI